MRIRNKKIKFAAKFNITDKMDLADTMKMRRKALGISQQDLSEMSGVSLATIKDIERGQGNPSLSTVQKILGILGMEVKYVVRQTL